MSPAQRAAIAKQHGISLDSGLATANENLEAQTVQEPLRRPSEYQESEPMEERTQDRTVSRLPRFGERFFAMDDSMYEPPRSSAVPQNYLLGPGDRLSVTLFGKVTARHEVIVEQDGSMVVPEFGPVPVSGLTFTELKRLVSKVVSEGMIGTEVFVSPVALRQVSVMVVGEVKKPGNYLLSALANPIHALYTAGGPSDLGSYRNIKLTKLDGESFQLDLYKLLLGGEPLMAPLSDGDILHVPPFSSEVSIKGEVNRPARYEIAANSTISEVIKLAGGPTTRAYSKGMILQRFDTLIGAPSIIQVDGFDSSLVLKHGDEISIRSVSNKTRNVIKISGAPAWV